MRSFTGHGSRTLQLAAAALALLLPSSAGAALFRVDDVAFIQQTFEAGRGQKALVSADFNGDGHSDLVVADGPGGGGAVYLGDGTGLLSRVGAVALGPEPGNVAAADLDLDGVLDLVVANHETSYLTLLIGDGRGGFAPAPSSPLVVDVAPHPHVADARDLDGDGRADLVVDSRDGRSLVLLHGLGGGAFETPGMHIAAGGAPYRGFAIGDIDGNGYPDLVTPNENEVGVLLNAGRPEAPFKPAASVSATDPFAVALADLDGDGKLDLISASESGPVIEVFLGDGQGGFRAAESAGFRIFAGAKNIAIGDINGDGLKDAMVTSWSSDGLIILGGRSALRSVRVPFGNDQNPWGLAVVDLNEDGNDDFVVADGVESRNTVYLSFEP